jgi:PEP-CTERM motif
VKGTFQLGTLVIPLGDYRTSTTKKGVTAITDSFLDTSWTNTAFVNVRPDGPVTGVPEPSTWAMLLLGFAVLATSVFGAARGQSRPSTD